MAKTLWISAALLVLVGLASIPLGIVAPTTSEATPYMSALSDLAVSTADACPCNVKICQANVCVADPNPDEPHGCCITGQNCQYSLCFP